MLGKLAEPIDSIAVMIDKANLQTEGVHVDHIFVDEFLISYSKNMARFILGFAGKDSGGRLRTFEGNTGAVITISGEGFDAMFRDVNGNPVRELTKDFLDDVFVSALLPRAIQRWQQVNQLVLSDLTVDDRVAIKVTPAPAKAAKPAKS